MNGANFGDINGDGQLEIVTLTYVQNFSPDDPVIVTAYALNQPVENLVFGTYKGSNDRMGWIQEEEVVVTCNPVRDLTVDFGGDVPEVYLHWTEPESGSTGYLLGYFILRDGELIADSVMTTEYADTEVEFFETYEYVVTAVYDDNCEAASAPLSVTPIPDAIQESGKDIKVYPNPANETLHVEGTGVLQVEVFNILGQSVLSINEGYGSIRLNGLENGVYFVRLKTTKGDKTIKLVIE